MESEQRAPGGDEPLRLVVLVLPRQPVHRFEMTEHAFVQQPSKNMIHTVYPRRLWFRRAQ